MVLLGEAGAQHPASLWVCTFLLVPLKPQNVGGAFEEWSSLEKQVLKVLQHCQGSVMHLVITQDSMLIFMQH